MVRKVLEYDHLRLKLFGTIIIHGNRCNYRCKYICTNKTTKSQTQPLMNIDKKIHNLQHRKKIPDSFSKKKATLYHSFTEQSNAAFKLKVFFCQPD